MKSPGMEEIEALRALAGEAEAFAPEFGVDLTAWKNRACKLQSDDRLDSFAGEAKLEALAMDLRAAWLRFAHERCGRFLMSPPHEQPKFMPSGSRLHYDYDRTNRPDILEARGLAGVDVPPGWDAMCMLFASGMAALSTLVQACVLPLEGGEPGKPLQFAMFGGYFETWRLLDLHRNSGLTVRFFHEGEKFSHCVGNGDAQAVLIEPVAYDWNMAIFDLEVFADAWRQAGMRRPKLVVVDASLTADRFTIRNLVSAFGDTPPWLVVFVRSGVKLDQQGMELANVGVTELFTPKGRRSRVKMGPLRERLTAARSVMGTGLSVLQTASLDAPWFLNRKATRVHTDKVFGNNRLLADGIRLDGGIFSHVAHPTLRDNEDSYWATAPFVALHLREDTVADHGKLVAILVHEARQRGLRFELGSSFGFRGHRFEVIRPFVHIREQGEHAGLLKVAMGSRGGPAVEAIVALIQEIAAFPDWASLRDAYRNVPAYVKSSFGYYVRRPPRS